MLETLHDMRVLYHRIRTMAIAIDQPMLVYLAEMGIAECDDQMKALRARRER